MFLVVLLIEEIPFLTRALQSAPFQNPARQYERADEQSPNKGQKSLCLILDFYKVPQCLSLLSCSWLPMDNIQIIWPLELAEAGVTVVQVSRLCRFDGVCQVEEGGRVYINWCMLGQGQEGSRMVMVRVGKGMG